MLLFKIQQAMGVDSSITVGQAKAWLRQQPSGDRAAGLLGRLSKFRNGRAHAVATRAALELDAVQRGGSLSHGNGKESSEDTESVCSVTVGFDGDSRSSAGAAPEVEVPAVVQQVYEDFFIGESVRDADAQTNPASAADLHEEYDSCETKFLFFEAKVQCLAESLEACMHEKHILEAKLQQCMEDLQASLHAQLTSEATLQLLQQGVKLLVVAPSAAEGKAVEPAPLEDFPAAAPADVLLPPAAVEPLVAEINGFEEDVQGSLAPAPAAAASQVGALEPVTEVLFAAGSALGGRPSASAPNELEHTKCRSQCRWVQARAFYTGPQWRKKLGLCRHCTGYWCGFEFPHGISPGDGG